MHSAPFKPLRCLWWSESIFRSSRASRLRLAASLAVQESLNILGYHCWHSFEFFTDISQCAFWNAALDAKYLGHDPIPTRADFDRILGAHSAVSADTPAICLAEELIAAYPDAKVLLVERDIDSWYRSFDRTIVIAFFARVPNLVADWDPGWLGAIRDCHARWGHYWLRARSADEMRANAKDLYRAHYAMVRRVTPPERLLEFRLGDGWAPLCRFLGKEVPDVPFPRVNDETAMWATIWGLVRKGAWNVLRKASLWALVGVAAVLVGYWISAQL